MQAVQGIPEGQVQRGVFGVSQGGGSGPLQVEGQAGRWRSPFPVGPAAAGAGAAALRWSSAQAPAQWVAREMGQLGPAEEGWGREQWMRRQVGGVVVGDPAADPANVLEGHVDRQWLAYRGS